jgi:uncharacterized membrane protein YccC
VSEIETAQQHLADALKRLEGAVMRRMMRPPPTAGPEIQQAFDQLMAERDGLARDVSMLRAECDRLSAALSEAERDQRSLREVTGRVAQKLDGSIAEIDRLLEG